MASKLELFKKLWDHHPGYSEQPCDGELFANQCAIRMGVALNGAGIDTSSFDVRRCSSHFPALRDHAPGHILGAQELANALVKFSQRSWPRESRKQRLSGSIKANWDHFKLHKGIVFIRNGWGTTDHIDLWNGLKVSMPGAGRPYLTQGEEVWFWRLA